MAVNNNKIIYFDENVPDYYVNGSRDFQLLTRLLTFALNAGKVEADQLLYLNDALLTNNNLLPLLQTKVGFWSDFEFPDDAIRLVCDVFDLIVRRKGSRRGIVEAIEIYLRSIGISTDFDIFIQNKDVDGNPMYRIEIGINALWHDYTLLAEILKYIIPTGYILLIYFYDKIEFIDKSILYSDFVLVTASGGMSNAQLRNEYYSSTTEQWKVLGARIVDENEALIFGEWVDGVFVPLTDLNNRKGQMKLEGHPESATITVKADPLKVNLTKRAENVNVPPGAVCYIFSSDDSGLYNGIQSIDLTRIYDANYDSNVSEKTTKKADAVSGTADKTQAVIQTDQFDDFISTDEVQQDIIPEEIGDNEIEPIPAITPSEPVTPVLPHSGGVDQEDDDDDVVIVDLQSLDNPTL